MSIYNWLSNLFINFKTQKNVEDKLTRIFLKLREYASAESGYARGNLINLLKYSNIDLANYDFSPLAIKQADLRQVNMKSVHCQNAVFDKSVFSDK